ncbi:Phage major capsid protein [Alphaproteobacteria bacterium]
MTTQELKNLTNTAPYNHGNLKSGYDQGVKETKTTHTSETVMGGQFATKNNDQARYFQATPQRPVSETKALEESLRPLPYPQCEKNTELEYKNAFCQYLRHGIENKLLEMECKAQNLDGLGRGDIGYSITASMMRYINTTLMQMSPMRGICNVIEISTDALELIEGDESIFTGWSESGLAEVEKSSEMQFKKIAINVHELYAQPKATQKLIDDPRIDIEKWLSDKLVESFHLKETEAFINGDGQGKPRGILSYQKEIENINSGIDGQITSDSIINLCCSLKEKYVPNAKFLMSREALQMIRTLKDKTGQYLWQPGLNGATPNTIFGYPIIVSTHMPTLAKDGVCMIFGDFQSAYCIVDRQDIKILRDPFTQKPYVKFYTTKRVGGALIKPEALKLLKLSVQ